MRRDMSGDIQGLRALAVGLVVAFHIDPGVVPGGYVGVDVFFVLSGYLITRGLLRQLATTGTIRLREFYVRRILRLLPAAIFVLVVVACLTPVILSPSRWEDTAQSLIASALYIENWVAAFRSVDYLAAEDDPSPILHYWSLSVEEQFYLLWPILLMIVARLASRSDGRGSAIAVMMITVAVLSFGLSVYSVDVLGRKDAYFTLHTRIWELALGGLLAHARWEPSQLSRYLFRFAGIALIVGSSIFLGRDSSYPGLHALAPTLGALAIITSIDISGMKPSFLSNPLTKFIGDISYSLYLWHWPIVIFLISLSINEFSLAFISLALVLSVGLAWLTKIFIEDSVRVAFVQMPRDAFRASACLAVSAIPVLIAGVIVLRSDTASSTSVAGPGGAVLFEGTQRTDRPSGVPALVTLKKDKPVVYERDCHVKSNSDQPIACMLREAADSDLDVLVVGDSHAANWVPAFQTLAETRNWSLVSHTKSACALVIKNYDGNAEAINCRAWISNVLQIIEASKPDLVVWSWYAPTMPFDTGNLFVVWKRIVEAGSRVVAIVDTPRLSFSPGECLKRNAACSTPTAASLPNDPLRSIKTSPPGVSIIDMSDAFCPGDTCPLIIGDVIVWRDRHHITASYSRSLASELGKRLDAALEGTKYIKLTKDITDHP